MAIFADPQNQCHLLKAVYVWVKLKLMELIALGCLCMGQVVMNLIIILAELEQASLFAKASQLYSDLKFYFLLQICWVWVKGYHV